jgi:hypothetical protein
MHNGGIFRRLLAAATQSGMSDNYSSTLETTTGLPAARFA